MSNESETPRPRHYIIVVHGIGEQRHNDTTVEVVNRFATARATPEPGSPYAGLLPASLSSLSMRRKGGGQGWSEYKGIPVEPGRVSTDFDGTCATDTAGKNFRFVDMRWADILQSHQEVFGATTAQWTAALLARLGKPFTPEGWFDGWVESLLKEIQHTMLPVQGLLKRFAPETEKTIFQHVIGDIHLYGDYARTRGQAVRRFHRVLDEIHLRDYIQWCRFERASQEEPYEPPVYTIIAHSLGSVLTFDALLYAFAKERIRDGTEWHPSGSIPIPGYTEREESEHESWMGLLSDLKKPPRDARLPQPHDNVRLFGERYPQFWRWHGTASSSADSARARTIPLLLWRDHVKHFISLGSPIDKFLTLWHQNYRHVGLSHHSFPDAWSQTWLEDGITPRITHFNLCDEQDPVGHHLDVAHETAVYRQVFQTDMPVTYRDVVFRRYAVPGLAHVQYWKDQALFDRLITGVIDAAPFQAGSPGHDAHLRRFVEQGFVEVDGAYDAALVWAYFRIPLLASIVTGLLLSYGWIGWWYDGFSTSSSLSLLAGIVLWIAPRPLEAYRQEVKPEHLAQQRRQMSLSRRKLSPWALRRGICAGLVAGAVAWRRILIALNVHPNPAHDVEEAVSRKIRLSLPTAGNFVKGFQPRILSGLALFLVAALGTWCGQTHLFEVRDGVTEPPAVYIALLVLLTVSAVYLGAMGYVKHCFEQMKRDMPDAATEAEKTTMLSSPVS